MSGSELVVRCVERVGELRLADAELREVASGLSELRARVAPGLYMLRVSAGLHVREDYLRVASEGVEVLQRASAATTTEDPLEVHAGEVVVPRLWFATHVPLAGTAPYDSAVTAAAERIDTGPAAGGNARLFLFARGATLQGDLGITLHEAYGRQLHELDGKVRRDGSCVGARVVLAPGFYRLRAGAMEVGVWLVAGWESQVFVPLDRDLSRASILMSRTPFLGDDPALRLAELGRLALLSRRPLLSAPALAAMLDDSFDNPTLWLAQAHLMLLDEGHSRVLMKELVDRLAELLGPEQSDVAALAFGALGKKPPPGAFAFPPMLVSSWQLALRASAAAFETVPTGSFSSAIALRRYAAGPWLTWKPPDAAGPGGEAKAERAADPAARIVRVIENARVWRDPDRPPVAGAMSLAAVAEATGIPAGDVRMWARSMRKRGGHDRWIDKPLAKLSGSWLPLIVALGLLVAAIIAGLYLLTRDREDPFVPPPLEDAGVELPPELEVEQPPEPDVERPPEPDVAVIDVVVETRVPTDAETREPPDVAETPEPPSLKRVREIVATRARGDELDRYCRSGMHELPQLEELTQATCKPCKGDTGCRSICKKRVEVALTEFARGHCCSVAKMELGWCLQKRCLRTVPGAAECEQRKFLDCPRDVIDAYWECQRRADDSECASELKSVKAIEGCKP